MFYTAQQVKDLLHGHFTDPTMEHTVQPGIVYISNPTENGTMYNKAELEALRAVCDEYDIPVVEICDITEHNTRDNGAGVTEYTQDTVCTRCSLVCSLVGSLDAEQCLWTIDKEANKREYGAYQPHWRVVRHQPEHCNSDKCTY